MDLTLSDDQKAFRAVAREFLDKEVLPHRAEWDRAEAVDPAIIPKLGAIGFFGLTIPGEYGGIGGDYITYCLGMEELGRADSSVRGIVSVSMGLVGNVLLSHGSEEQKQQWLPQIATGSKLACFALAEPGAGSDPGNLATSAVPDGGDYLLSGQKVFITNATWADLCLVFARTGGPGPKGISAFLVPTGTPGFETREIKGKLGLRGQATAEMPPRTLTAATAGALGLAGAVLGTVAAYIGAIAYAWDNPLDGLSELSSVPTENLLIILIGMPLIAAGVGWLLAGREPSAITHQPIE